MGFIRRIKDWWESAKRAQAEFETFSLCLDKVQEEYESEIEPLSMQEAKVRAERLLADSNQFRCTLATERDWGLLDNLAPLAQEFFRTYDEVLQLTGDLILSRHVMQPAPVDPGMMIIGSSGEEHTYQAIHPGEEMVYHLDEDRLYFKDQLPYWLVFPSVYHCILYYDRKEALLPP